ncbi:MAG: heme-binding protein [Chlamydiota bacterium]
MTSQNKQLSLAMAKKIGEAIEKKAVSLNLRLVISILDESGNLKYFIRMDGTSFGSIRISQLKANTSASMPISSKALGEKNEKMANSPYGSIPGIVLLGGGLPILTKSGHHLGGVGVSGATPELDELCAACGLDAIEEDLK